MEVKISENETQNLFVKNNENLVSQNADTDKEFMVIEDVVNEPSTQGNTDKRMNEYKNSELENKELCIDMSKIIQHDDKKFRGNKLLVVTNDASLQIYRIKSQHLQSKSEGRVNDNPGDYYLIKNDQYIAINAGKKAKQYTEDFTLEHEFNFDDFIGAEISTHKSNNELAKITFHSTIFKQDSSCCTKKINKAYRTMVTLDYFNNSIYALNDFRHYQMEKWWAFAKEKYNSGIQDLTTYTHNLHKNYLKKIMMFINPNGGKGQAKKLYLQVERYLKSNGFIIEVIYTKNRPQVLEIVRDMPVQKFKEYFAFVSCSGDGIPHEIINGFYQRPDHELQKLRLGALPGGSGSGICLNANLDWGLKRDVVNSMYVLTRAKFQGLNVTKYKTNGSTPIIYGFLSYSIGYFSDLDINSEFLRCMGNARFVFYAYLKLCNLYHRKWKLWVTDQENLNIDDMGDINGEFIGDGWKFYENQKFYAFLYVSCNRLTSCANISNRIKMDSR